MSEEIADAIKESFISNYGNVIDAIVDSFQNGGKGCDKDFITAIDDLSDEVKRVAEAITPPAMPGKDACGGTVISLTESVMGITSGLVMVAEAIQELAESVRNKSE